MANATTSGSSAAQGHAAAPNAAAPKPRTRTPYWDNARAIAIVLVVIGHAIQPLNSALDLSYATYLAIYAFHMPAFALLAGYFSRADPSPQQVARVATDILVPYLIFETIWTAIRVIGGAPLGWDPTTASWTLWFLLALAIFRLLLPLLARLRAPLLVAILVSVATGYFEGVDTTFSLSRALGLLPFFLLGWWLNDRDVIGRLRWLERDRRDRVVVVARGIAVALFVAVFTVALLGTDTSRAIGLGRMLFYADSYSELGLDGIAGGAVRLAVIGVGVLLTVALLALVPRGAQPYTWLGAYTLYVYLLHTFPLGALRASELTGEGAPALVWYLGLLLGAVALTVVLASKPVRLVARPLVEPRVGWLLARER